MVRYRERLQGDALFSGINIVPFTDVVLVLLIIFMIAAPGLVSSGLNINLPGASQTDPRPAQRITIGVDRGGALYLEGKALSLEALRKTVRERIAAAPETAVALHADRDADYGKVVELLDLARAAGARKIYVGAVRQ
ncbi:MAG: biopolymer transporter ExbD [Leptospirales bacterium]|nr:biopolymer transporter ExbD [Leptospirales bacterium]